MSKMQLAEENFGVQLLGILSFISNFVVTKVFFLILLASIHTKVCMFVSHDWMKLRIYNIGYFLYG